MKLNIFSGSIVCGDRKCNANCPWCISKMTAKRTTVPQPEWDDFPIFCGLAKEFGATTMLLTGQGEPTLYPELISKYLYEMNPVGKRGRGLFKLVELQTNGIGLLNMEDQLKKWHQQGLTLICLSLAHFDSAKNQELMQAAERLEIWDTVKFLTYLGFGVRINITMVKGGVDNENKVIELVDRCREFKSVTKNKRGLQITVRDVATPTDEETRNPAVTETVKSLQVNLIEKLDRVMKFEKRAGKATELLRLPHGGVIWDWGGQNFCLNNCITSDTNREEVRQLIFFPNGTISYDWKYEAAILL